MKLSGRLKETNKEQYQRIKLLTAIVSNPHSLFTNWAKCFTAISNVVVPQVFRINLFCVTNILLSLLTKNKLNIRLVGYKNMSSLFRPDT